jgi:N-methylhydantoinase A/oxoprolinase/acetone carboxylase beta subunit
VIAAAVFCWWGALLGLATGMGVLAIAGARRMGGADILWSTAAGALSAPGMLLAWSALLITRAITQQLARPLMLPAVPILVAGGAIGLVTTGIAR